MMLDKGKPKYSERKLVPMPLRPSQISHGQTFDRTGPRPERPRDWNLETGRGGLFPWILWSKPYLNKCHRYLIYIYIYIYITQYTRSQYYGHRDQIIISNLWQQLSVQRPPQMSVRWKMTIANSSPVKRMMWVNIHTTAKSLQETDEY